MNALVPPATSASDIAVDARGLCKTFRQRQRSEKLSEVFANLWHPRVRLVEALRDVDLQVRRGEIVAYAGPNGAGKSTTVKILSGILAPDAGQVRVLGLNPIADRIRYVGRIGVVFGQRTELWWDQPVAASFEWKRVVWEIPRPRYERMLGQVRELLGLDEFFHSLTRELSLGQRMRADLGLALLREPEILFLDEPTIGVDVLAKRHILEFIIALNRDRQVTVMLTSHDMDELQQLAGRIAFDGDFDQLRRRFADRRRLRLQTRGGEAPQLQGADLLGSEGGWHEYRFDAGQTEIVALLEQARTHAPILDVATHRAPIDEVIADLYQQWRQ
ncbi:MAG: ATP-binding cassette domain-containing protein [Candidatus Latescibacteria bacterium]|nr:ATP-binding cassette domain-containing protein [Candidatus Latescibacterota bacterium]